MCQFLLLGSRDDRLYFWNINTGTQEYPLGQTLLRGSIFSSNLQLLAAKGLHGLVEVWSSTTRTLQNRLIDPTSDFCNIFFSPDSQVLAYQSVGRAIKLWDTTIRSPQPVFEGHSNYVDKLVCSPDVKVIASASGDGTIRLWDAVTGLCQRTLAAPGVVRITFSRDSKLLRIVHHDGTAKVFNVETGEQEQVLIEGVLLFQTVVYSSNGNFVAFVALKSLNTIKLHNARTCSYLNTLQGHTSTVRAIAFSPNSKLLASLCEHMAIRLWDTQTGAVQFVLEPGHPWTLTLVFSPDSQVIAIPMDDGIAWWDLGTGIRRQTLGMRKLPRLFAFSSDTKLLAVAMDESLELSPTIALWDLTTCRFTQTLQGYEGSATEIMFSPKAQFLAVASRYRTVGLWSMSSFSYVRTLGGHVDRVTTIKFSPDEQILATGSLDRTVRVWETTTGMLIQIVQYDAGFIRGIYFARRGFVVSVSDNDLDSLCDVLNRNLWDETVWNKAVILKDYTYPITATQETVTLEATLSRRVSLNVDRTWITRGCEKIIWLPEDYRPTNMRSWTRRGSTLFIGSSSGRVYQLRVS
jgi:WD40 repeat protein